MKFYTVDAFSSVAYGGNPSSIVLLDEGMDFPPVDEMLKIAKEIGYSETAFVKNIDPDKFNIRFLSLSKEIDLSTRTTIGAFSVMSREGLIEENRTYLCETLGGNLLVHVNGDDVYVEMSTDDDFGDMTQYQTLNKIYEHLGIPRETIIKEKTSNLLEDFIPEPIAASLPDIVMPVLNPTQMQLLEPSIFAFANMDLPANADNSKAILPKDKIQTFALQLNNFDNNITSHLPSDLDEISSEDLFSSKTSKRPVRKLGLIENVNGKMKVRIGGSGVVLTDGQIFL